jgi:hypothetical protein
MRSMVEGPTAPVVTPTPLLHASHSAAQKHRKSLNGR